MCIYFDEYPRYSGRNSEIFEKYVNENIQCVRGYAYSSGKQKMCTSVNEESLGMMKTCFLIRNQIKKCPENVLSKKIIYVQKYITENDEKIDSTKYNEPTFLSSFFRKDLFFTVKTIE